MTEINFAGSNRLPPFSKFIENIPSSEEPPLASPSNIASQSWRPNTQTTGMAFHPTQQPEPYQYAAPGPAAPAANTNYNYAPQYHNYSSSYPVAYRFPVVPAVPQTQVQQVHPQQASFNETVTGLNMMGITSDEVTRSMNCLREQYIHLESISTTETSPSETYVRLPNAMYVSTRDFMLTLTSIPPGTLSSLEFYTQEYHRIIQNLRRVQTTCFRSMESHAPEERPVKRHRRQQAMSDTVLSYGHTTNRSGSGSPVQKKASSKSPSRGSYYKFDSSKDKSARPIKCNHCGSEKTPEWRRGPDGEKTLCNACGIFYSKLIKKYESPATAANIMSDRKASGLVTDRHI